MNGYFQVKIPKKTLLLISVLLLVFGAAAGIFTGVSRARQNFVAGQTKVAELIQEYKKPVGSILLASYSRWMAGDKIPVDDVVYGRSYVFNQWGQETNAQWVTDQARIIVPFLVYEKASVDPGIYPTNIGFVPYMGDRSFNVGGSFMPDMDLVMLNEKMVLGTDEDLADILAVLTHELIHAQGGAFLYGSSEQLESATEAATIEVLAAMCNYSDVVACRAFWKDVEGYARTELRIWLRGKFENGEAVYQRISDAFWRDTNEIKFAAKSGRYWAENEEARDLILKKYVTAPWRKHILPGLLGSPLNTRLLKPEQWYWMGYNYVPNYVMVGMPFDDTFAMLDRLSFIMLWLYVT